MTAFSTPCCRSARDGARVLRHCLAWLALLAALAAHGGEIRVRSALLAPGDEAYVLDAEFDINIGPRLEEAVARGVSLYFVLEFDLTRPRWYWADEHVAGKVQHYRLSYNALTRQYRLSVGALHQSYASLDEALRVLSRIRNWPVADKSQLKAGEVYDAAVRLKLDLSQLPKPFQVSAIGNKDWNVAAEVRRWNFVPGAAEREGK